MDCTTNGNNYNKPSLAAIQLAIFDSQVLKNQGDGAIILEVWNSEGKYNIELMEKVHISGEMALEIDSRSHRLVGRNPPS